MTLLERLKKRRDELEGAVEAMKSNLHATLGAKQVLDELIAAEELSPKEIEDVKVDATVNNGNSADLPT